MVDQGPYATLAAIMIAVVTIYGLAVWAALIDSWGVTYPTDEDLGIG